MCNMSVVGDLYADQWRQLGYDRFIQQPLAPSPLGGIGALQNYGMVPRAEFDALKREVEEMKAALKAAKAEDEAAGNPDCEMADKMAVLRKVAELVGVNLDDVFGKAASPG